jgi:hypothetical protein
VISFDSNGGRQRKRIGLHMSVGDAIEKLGDTAAQVCGSKKFYNLSKRKCLCPSVQEGELYEG